MNKNTRKIQIGVMGSCADLKEAKQFEKLAEEVGFWVAKNNATLVFGAEKDFDSLSTAACRGAKKADGLTVGITYGKGLDILEKNVDVVITSGLERGGGREFALVLSCDAIIAINGGSGTLTEIAIAYQANIPIVTLENTGGWSQKLAGQYLDARQRIKIEVGSTPKKAVELALKLIKRKNGNEKQITLISTFAEDKLLNEKGEILSTQKGGPALWITSVFKKEGLNFDIITGPEMTVELLIRNNDEFGKIQKNKSKRKVYFSKIKTPYLLISSLLDEFNLNNISDYSGKVFLDAQGFVRNGKDFGKKKFWDVSEKTMNSIFCLKTTEEEVKYLSKDFINQQKSKVLMITKGKKGCEVFIKNKKYTIKPQQIIAPPNTIGAGDTFFSSFVANFIRTDDILSSVNYGMLKTSEFLKTKFSHHN